MMNHLSHEKEEKLENNITKLTRNLFKLKKEKEIIKEWY